ncbi:hypothetical protein BCR34DRAFT_641381 [Clohesyomyces aquaticus]|uniref:Uncharacterized protein n=1 Tax=Clohesyomyces aquaticus TaxID=1231657 RepID=A0A1Y1YJC7_9PLEO|nr:hypothetical protein BCR34DRAFT_641381 [Clohesyomyces aquaticus]
MASKIPDPTTRPPEVDSPTPKEAKCVGGNLVKWILPFLCVGCRLVSAILGIIKDAHLTLNQYNWLSSIFYLGYLLAEWWQSLALQRFPRGKGVILLLLLHIPCISFASLFRAFDRNPSSSLRLFLGIAKACIVLAFLIILSMSFTYDEQAVLMPCMWEIGNPSPLTSGLLSYGVLWINTGSFGPRKRFMVITGILTVLFGIAVWILPPTEMANGLTNQYSMIIKSFGFTTLQTRLLGCSNDLTALVSLGAAALFLAKTTNCRAWLSIAAYAANCYAGHTKRTVVTALYHPAAFQPQYAPRYIVPWAVILVVVCILPSRVVLVLRWYMVRENRRRDALESKGKIQEVGIMQHFDESGESREEVVDARQLDLTDRENLAFRYVL